MQSQVCPDIRNDAVMGNLSTNRWKFYMILSSVILPTIYTMIYTSFSASAMATVGGFSMAHISFSGNSSTHHESTIKNVKKLIKYQRNSKKKVRKQKKSHRAVTVPGESKLNDSSSLQEPRAAAEILVHPVLTITLYEPGHLKKGVDIQRICRDGGIFIKLLILITSAQLHFMERMSVRQTWMHFASRRDVGMAFVLGRAEDWKLNKALNEESYLYGDMIRGHFIDSYFNLTLKTLSLLEWVDAYCPHAKYILKTDDDMFINVPRLLEFIDGHSDKRTIYGRVVEGQQPERNSVPDHQYEGLEFPKYATGGAYLLNRDIVQELYMQSLSSSYFPQEDIFITGIMAERLNISRVHAAKFRNVRIALLPCSVRNAISIHEIKPHEQYELWRLLLTPAIKCKKVWQDADADAENA